jgi:PAS domain-containing protein
MLAAAANGKGPTRAVSPVDGVERFGAVAAVPDYPLVVTVTRDAAAALGPWRAQTLRSGLRTLALAGLALLLLHLVLRSLRRLDAARASLEVSQERFALAAAGSDDGVWDWDLQAGTAFESKRARELQGLPPSPETQPLAELQASLAVHPDDAALREERRCARTSRAARRPTKSSTASAMPTASTAGSVSARSASATAKAGPAESPARSATSTRESAARWRCARARSASRSPSPARTTASGTGTTPAAVRSRRTARARSSACAKAPSSSRSRRGSSRSKRGCTPTTWRAAGRRSTTTSPAARLRTKATTACASQTAATAGSTPAACASATRAGAPQRMAGSVSDIDARKRAEEALRVSEERYAIAMTGSHEGHWVWGHPR